MQLDWHDLRTNGCPALLRALKKIETALTQQAQDIRVLQYEHGGRMERQQPAPNANAATSDPPARTDTATITVENIDRQMASLKAILNFLGADSGL
jgi:hypothetical protein